VTGNSPVVAARLGSRLQSGSANAHAALLPVRALFFISTNPGLSRK